jgi:undecaprenyl diphosphate synthase
MNSLRHIACTMDGNRRWARRQSVSMLQGYREGLAAAQRVVDYCLKHSIPYLSLFALSAENAQRSKEETQPIYALLCNEADSAIAQACKQEVHMRFVGDLSLCPPDVKAVCERITRETAHGKKLRVDILFCYGSKQELVHVAQSLINKVERKELSAQAITQELFEQHLWTYDTPMPDMMIRTGLVTRLSNFLLYQAAYAELYFPPCLWPDITHEHLDALVEQFTQCKRNFGA